MSRRRFHVPGDSIRGGIAILPPDQAHHLRHVLRLRGGTQVEVFDGAGTAYRGTVRISGDEVRIEDLSRLASHDEPHPRLILAQALVKAQKLEWILQKGTELGVDEFILLEARFSGIRFSEGAVEGRMKRWNRIVSEAAKQSHRMTMPGIRGPISLPSLLSAQDMSGFEKLFLYERAADRWNGSLPLAPGYVLCIGPEGGWHASEAEQAAASGCRLVNLGPRILRAETAALAAVALAQFRTAQAG